MPVLAEKPLPEMTERISFNTDIRFSFTAEYRDSLRDPKTQIGYRFRVTDARYQAFEETLLANLKADWTVPFWHERTRNLNLSASQTVISCNTDADYRVGGTAIVWKGCEEYETATIDAVGSGSITLSTGLTSAYTGAAVMPAHEAYIYDEIERTRANRGLMEYALSFELRTTDDLAATPWLVFDTYEVLGCSSGYLSSLSGPIRPAVEYFDSGLGPVVIEDDRQDPWRRFAVEISGHAWDVKRFLHQVRGMDAPFWVKSWGGRLELQSATATDEIIVDATQSAANLVGRRVVVNGSYREILSVVDNGATYTLTLNASVTASVGDPVSLLSLVRADTDTFDIQHRHGFSSLISFPVLEV